MSSSPTATPAVVQPYVDAAKRYVERALGVTLDGSEASLAFVDHYIRETARKEALKPEVLALVAPALGVYFGEVAIGRLGGKWELDGDDPTHWRVELGPTPLWCTPVGMAAAALRGGEVEGYDGSFSTREELMGPLLQALEASPPVDEEYYFSFTGRIETLTHAVDILVELERARREPPN